MNLSIGSLFAGTGGLEIGLEQSGIGHTVWQVEKDAKCRAVLARHWPSAKRYEDVRSVGAGTLSQVDLICGGFPCQDVSSAGKRAGLSGARSGLWFEFARVVAELAPRWVVVENVASGASRWVDAVRESLEQHGYASLPVPISASDCGAPHRRARIFIVAHRRPSLAHADNAVGSSTERPAANSDGVQLRIESGGGSGPRGAAGTILAAEASAYAHDHASVVHDEPRNNLPNAQRFGGWATEPDVARMVRGLPGRVDRERMLGNAVVPAQAEVIGHVIRMLSQESP